MCCFVILLLFNEIQMNVRRFSAIPHLRENTVLAKMNNYKHQSKPTYASYTFQVLIVRQVSFKSGLSTALYDKSIKLGTLILDITGNIFKI